MHAIDDLSNSEPRRYFETLKMSTQEYLSNKASQDPFFRGIVCRYFHEYLSNTDRFSDDQDQDLFDEVI